MFTIIIPTYNSSDLITKCLESICGQTFNNYEVIVVDGLSTDNTLQLVEAYRNKLPYLKISSEKDMGIYDAMNKGMSMAQGEWLYFMGSDDIFYDENVLSDISVELNGQDVVYAKVYSKSLGGNYGSAFSSKKIYFRNIAHQGIFFRKNVFSITGLFDLKYKIWADWDHNFKWFLNPAIKKKFINLIVSNYADGGFSATRKDHAFEKDKAEKYFQLNGKKIRFKILHRIYYILTDLVKNKSTQKYY